MAFPKKKIGKQGRWIPGLLLLFSPIIVVFSARWLLYEPFVIPSGSMEPNLLVHDHLFVNKHSYGIRIPFGEGWLINFKSPERGDVVVFRYPQNKKIFFIKRLIGLPGDKIFVQNGQITINDKPWTLSFSTVVPSASELDDAETADQFTYFTEKIPDSPSKDHLIKLYSSDRHADPVAKELVVPPNSYFVMGDNRDQSHDSRFWGFVDHDLLVGQASAVWLSCDEMMESAPMVCDPRFIRMERLFRKVK